MPWQTGSLGDAVVTAPFPHSHFFELHFPEQQCVSREHDCPLSKHWPVAHGVSQRAAAPWRCFTHSSAAQQGFRVHLALGFDTHAVDVVTFVVVVVFVAVEVVVIRRTAVAPTVAGPAHW